MTTEAIFNLAMQRHQAGQLPEAVDLYRQALSQEPDNWQVLFNLANALRRQQKANDAIDAYRRVIAAKPDFAEAHFALGKTFQEIGQPKLAIASYTEALRLRLDFPEGHNSLGNALASLGRLDEAMASFRRALALRPDYPEAQSNLGNALRESGDIEAAISVGRRALEMRPDYPEACNNLATALYENGEYDESISYYKKAIELRPDFALAHRNLGVLLLTKGDLVAGWCEHEWRWKVPQFYPPGRELARPLWDGSDLAGRRILIQAEQGLGDVIQMARYAPSLAQRGGKVIFRCPRELLRLFHTLEGVTQLLSLSESLPEFDVHCPVVSLPAAMRSDQATIPRAVPYLKADPTLKAKWAARVPTDGRLKIGLRWAGQPRHPNDHHRSFDLAELAPLAGIGNAWFCSLQKGNGSSQANSPPAGMEVADWTDELVDFADTAALMEQLDLIITADTAVAHLAGAMGKRTWVLLPFVPDWRWMLERNDSPWYPTLRLFRQERRGDWQTPIRKVAEAAAAGLDHDA
jgi:tetratricopeptide (TPR) repeat protein